MYHTHPLLIFCVFWSLWLVAPMGFSSPHNVAAQQSAHSVQLAAADRPQQSKLIAQARDFLDRWWQRDDKTQLSATTGNQRPLSQQTTTAEHSLDDSVTAHFESVSIDVLIEYLAPADWAIHFDIDSNRLKQQVVFHAETSRRRALDNLLSQVGLQGIFYPQSRMIVIAPGSTL